MRITHFIWFNCPDIKFMRKMISLIWVKRLENRMLSEDIISKAETDLEKKRSVVKRCDKNNKRVLKAKRQANHIIQEFYSELDEEEKDNLYLDILFCFFAYGFQPDEYHFFQLKNKSMQERTSYVSDVERNIYMLKMNDVCEGEVFLNKSKTYQYYKPYYKRDALAINSSCKYSSFSNFVDKHPVFVKKNVDLSKGDGVELIDIRKVGMSREEYFNKLKYSNLYQIEEKINQSKVMSDLNPSSVNTIRCNAFVTKNGVKVAFAFLKVGREGTFVDNAGKGGIIANIDVRTGKINTDGFDENDNTYKVHPESGVVFYDFQLPEWENVLQLCEEITPMIKGIQAIGWDLAYTDDGWVIVEGNLFSQFVCPQIACERGLKKEWLAVMQDMELRIYNDVK